MLVFFVLGFTRRDVQKTGTLLGFPRSLVVSAIVTALMLGPLTFLSVQFVQNAVLETAKNKIELDQTERHHYRGGGPGY